MKNRNVNISVAIITKNEEEIIGECLEAVSWADEVIVVDSGSSDDTVKIAKKHGARVFVNAWAGFGPQKNFALSKTRGKWILNIDADEIISPGLGEEILAVVKSKTTKAAYDMPFRNFFYGKWIRHGGLYPDRHARLFRKGKGRFPDITLHEYLQIDGEIGSLKNPVLHYTKGSITGHIASINTYTDIEKEQNIKSNYSPTGYTVFIRPLYRFIKCYFFKAGFLDGIMGLIFHVITSFGMFLGEIKILEARGMKARLLATLFKRAG
jgi:(heptosyl)LPS beta-1,4-glucosyltransferase